MRSNVSFNWNMILPVENKQSLNPIDAVYFGDCTLSQDATELTDLLSRERRLILSQASTNDSAVEALSLLDDALRADSKLAEWIGCDSYRSPKNSISLQLSGSEDVYPKRIDLYDNLPLARVTITWRLCRIQLLNMVVQASAYIQGSSQAWRFGSPAFFAGHEQNARALLKQLADDICCSVPFCMNAKDPGGIAHHYPHGPGAAPRLDNPTPELMSGMSMMVIQLSILSQIRSVPWSQRQWMQEYMTLLSKNPEEDIAKAMQVELAPCLSFDRSGH